MANHTLSVGNSHVNITVVRNQSVCQGDILKNDGGLKVPENHSKKPQKLQNPKIQKIRIVYN